MSVTQRRHYSTSRPATEDAHEPEVGISSPEVTLRPDREDEQLPSADG